MDSKALIITASALLFFASCGKNEDTPQDSILTDIKQEDQKTITADTTAISYQEPDETEQKDVYQPSIGWDKKIVKTATLQVEVNDYKRFSQQIGEIIKQQGGYISQEQQDHNDYKIENTITAKVPAGAFDETISRLLSGAERTEQRQILTDDVTAEFVDGKSRLEAKKQVRLRYLDLLKQARNMSEILNVQHELNDVQEEIEAVTGRLNYLGQAAAMSTIHFTYYQVLNPAADSGNKPFFTKLNDAFASGWHWLGQLLVGLTSIWPLLFLSTVVLLLFRKKVFKLNESAATL